MEKAILKSFALHLKNQLMHGVMEKITGDEDPSIIEDIGYNLFIRLISIRFMEVNHFIGWHLNQDFNVVDFIDICTYLETKMPYIFNRTEEHVYDLLPSNMFGKHSIISYLVEGIEESYWKMDFHEDDSKKGYGIEIIGWLYQYYFSDKKNKIFSSLKKEKLTKIHIPTATQIFTPKWIVQYMVENTLGKLWLEHNGNKTVATNWKYLIQENKTYWNGTDSNLLQTKGINPEQIKILDPAMGSGHILSYAFDVLYDIYRSCNYKEEEIPLLILEKNLYGLDIDDRVSKLAMFALLMKAMKKSVGILEAHPKFNLIAIKESDEIFDEVIAYIETINIKDAKGAACKEDVLYLINTFQNAKEYGALLNINPIDYDSLERWEEIKPIIDKLYFLIHQGRIMTQEYDVVITNPPYSGLRRLNCILKQFIEAHYKDYKYDLFSVFMVKNMRYTRKNGIAGFMTPNVWQFISSYENLRKYILDHYQLVSLIQLGDEGFKDASVAISTFVIKKCKADSKTIFIKLNSEDSKDTKTVQNKIRNFDKEQYAVDQRMFHNITGNKLAFWIGEKTMEVFKGANTLGDISKPRQGMATSDNHRFVRYWYEVNAEEIYFPEKQGKDKESIWFPYNKGGGKRKWYGNNIFVVNWQHNGYEIKEYAKRLYGNYSRTIKNESFYFRKGITYTFIGRDIAPRFSPEGFIFDVAGSMIFMEDEKLYYILGLLGCKVSKHLMAFINPSLNTQVGDIKSIPIVDVLEKTIVEKIEQIVIENIKMSKMDWDAYEISWDFKKHPFISFAGSCKNIKEAYRMWEEWTYDQFYQMKRNEERLNRLFIRIYGIEGELAPEVNENEITIRKANKERDVQSFISYAIGCILGRYSLDEEGLIYGGGNFEQKFKKKDGIWYIYTKKGWVKSSIIITEKLCLNNSSCQLYIVDKFIDFLQTVFGIESLAYNLTYIASILEPMSSEPAIEIIQRYFSKQFVQEHVRIYQNKPIYLVVEDENDPEALYLIYGHRYNKN